MDALEKIVISGKLFGLPPSFYSGWDKVMELGWRSKPLSAEEEAYWWGKQLPMSAETEPLGMFEGFKSLRSVTISGSVTFISQWCFAQCKALERVIIGEGTFCIGEFSFAACSNLLEVTLPNSLEILEWYAFKGCENLTILHIGPNVRLIEEGVFDGCKNLKLCVQENSYALDYAINNGIPYEITK